ncbi:hypothetical protein RI367_000832 [Sorochytrium milnesiophthora]
MDSLLLEQCEQLYEQLPTHLAHGKNDDTHDVDEYVAAVLSALDSVNQLLKQQQQQPELSVRQQRILRTLLDAVAALALYPHYEPGVGLSLAARFGTSLSKLSGDSLAARSQHVSASTLDNAIVALHGYIVKPVPRPTAFVEVMARDRCTTDLYAILLQLSFSPAQQQQHHRYSGMLSELFDRCDPTRTLSALTMLIGAQATVPIWLRKACGVYLTQILLRPKGVRLVLGYRLSSVPHPSTLQLEATSRLILSKPADVGLEDYLQRIVPQLTELLREGVANPTTPMHMAAKHALGQLILRSPAFGRTGVIDVLAEPLLRLYTWPQRLPQLLACHDDLNQIVLISASDTATAVGALASLLVGSDPAPGLVHAISHVAPLLLKLYSFTVVSKSHVHSALRTTIMAFLRLSETTVSVPVLEQFILSGCTGGVPVQSIQASRVWKWRPRNAPDGGLQVDLYRSETVAQASQLPDLFNVLDSAGSAASETAIPTLVSLLQEVGNDDLTASLLVALLQARQVLGDTEAPAQAMLLAQVIMSLMEHFGQAVIKRPGQILSFAYSVLARHSLVVDNAREGQEDSGDEEEELSMSLGLLSIVVSRPDDLDKECMRLLDSVLLLLTKLRTALSSTTNATLLDTVQTIIQQINVANLLRMALHDASDEHADAQQKSREQLRQGLQDLKSDIIPIRVHGMATLRNLILDKDPVAFEHIDAITDEFLRELKGEDSFAYLNAVKGLSALTDVMPERAIPKLLTMYKSGSLLDLDTRLRVGEALLQTIRRRGETFGTYAPQMLPALFEAARDPEVHVRASALSILSVACEECPLPVTRQSADLVDFVVSVLRHEQHAQVRRSAIAIVAFLFRSLGKELLHSVPADELQQLYRALRQTAELDNDDLSKGHARVALNLLDDIMREHLFPTAAKAPLVQML